VTVRQSECPSRTQVNRAGDVLRAWQLGENLEQEPYERAYDVLLAFRAAHQYPLMKATVGLRSMVRTEDCKVEVTQRLKRIPTILDKLVREPAMELGRMQDFGGCRAVLESIADVRAVERRVTRAMVKRVSRTPRTSDYIATPRASGYRGVHLVVEYDGRAIEVQLRTQVMHEWAITVEQLSGRLQEDLKSGRGAQELVEWLGAASEAMALEEAGQVVDQTALDRLGQLRARAVTYISGGPR
jgi:putative GTP pyrophosphokinase